MEDHYRYYQFYANMLVALTTSLAWLQTQAPNDAPRVVHDDRSVSAAAAKPPQVLVECSERRLRFDVSEPRLTLLKEPPGHVELRSHYVPVCLLGVSILTNPEAFQKFQEAQGTLTGALSKLLAITENYPDLKSNQNFLALQSQLEGTENRIAVARRDYIAAVQDYNTEIRTIPGRWWRALLYPDAQPMQNFTVAEETTKVPEVKF